MNLMATDNYHQSLPACLTTEESVESKIDQNFKDNLYLDTNSALDVPGVADGDWSTVDGTDIATTGGGSGNGAFSNASYVFYAWAAVSGVSAFGTYTGNAGAKTITYEGGNSFTAKFIMIKRTEGTAGWAILDSFRDGPGELTTGIYADLANAEESIAAWGTTPTSTGFTFDSGTTNVNINNDGSTYIYCAFA